MLQIGSTALANFTLFVFDLADVFDCLCFTLGVSWAQAVNETDNNAVKIIFDFILIKIEINIGIE
ncbi:hypothetical protein ACM39_10175 [Chryseobacterium sp. FH2]|nr:hypothetical protein ACM39_10175 [Chryseobacterium sp. FH2]